MFKRALAAVAGAALLAAAFSTLLVVPPAAFAQSGGGGAGIVAPVAGPVSQPVVIAQAAQPAVYSFSAGNVLASFVNWLWLAFGGTIVSVVMIGVRKWMALMGVQVNQQMNDRIEDRLRNGLNAAAAQAQVGLDGKFTVAVKNQVVAQAVEYARTHSADDLSALGLDPKSGEVTAALRAKAESVIVDPSQPTNPALAPNAAATK
jgi:hypothetical protein